jgi:2-methylcitrate dehydratase PrpD
METGIRATKAIADFVVATGFDQIPEKAVDIAKLAMLDTLGTALAGAQEPAVDLITEYVRNISDKAEASAIAKGFKTSAALAALINGTSGHVLDYDDASYSTLGHPTVVLLPAILALGETNRLSGAAIIEAYVLGFEVAAKIALGLGFDVYAAGWHCTSTIGVMGAAAAGAKILKLGSPQVRTALGIAASLASGLRQNFGTMTKPLHAGVAAQHGVMSALLASRGFTSDKNILEAPMGYADIYSPKGDPARMSAALGNPFDIVANGLSFKPYPSCRFTHHLIDAVLHLVKQHDIDAGEVTAVDCRISPVVTQVLIHHQPQTALEGKFSLEYCVARALLDKDVGLEHFTNEKVSAKKVQDMLPRIRYTHVHDDTKQKLGEGGSMPPAEVRLILRNGVELHHRVVTPRGDPENPMTAEELTLKFRDCAGRVLSPQKIDQCLDMLLSLDSLKDIRPLMDMVVADSATHRAKGSLD